jgi:hypothetical protein
MTHNCPKNALQLQDEFEIFALKTMLPNKMRKLCKVPPFAQDLTAKFGLGHLPVKMRWNDSVEGSVQR